MTFGEAVARWLKAKRPDLDVDATKGAVLEWDDSRAIGSEYTGPYGYVEFSVTYADAGGLGAKTVRLREDNAATLIEEIVRFGFESNEDMLGDSWNTGGWDA